MPLGDKKDEHFIFTVKGNSSILEDASCSKEGTLMTSWEETKMLVLF